MEIMKKMNIEKDLSALIGAVVCATGMNVPIKQDYSGINMSYNFIGDYISFDATRLLEAKNELMPSPSLEVYIKTMTLHELGHGVDRQALLASLSRTIEIYTMKKNHSSKEIYNSKQLLSMIIEEHEMNINFEETAWDNAWHLNQKLQLVAKHDFEHIKEHSLATYNKNYQMDLQLYNDLLSQHLLQLA